MKLSIKQTPIGKPAQSSGTDLTFGWQAVEFSLQQLLDHACREGKPLAVAVYKDGYRKSENFIESGVIIIDIDSGRNNAPLSDNELHELLTSDFVQRYCCAVYESYNSQPGAYRLRLVFILDQPITDARLYRDLVAALQKRLPFADPAAKDAARAFYGSRVDTSPLYINKAAGLPLDLLMADVVEVQRQREAAHARALLFTEQTPDLATVREALAYVPPITHYDTWLKVIAAIWSVYPGNEGIALIEGWSPGKPHEVETKFKAGFDGSITLGTLFHIAKQYGYQPPRLSQPPARFSKAVKDSPPVQGKTITLSERFITDAKLELTSGAYLISSDVGTGKTALLSRALKAYLTEHPEAEWLWIAPFISFTQNLQPRLAADGIPSTHYGELIGPARQYRRIASDLITTPQSLVSLEDRNQTLHSRAVLILDEISEVLDQVTGQTMLKGGLGLKGLAQLNWYIQQADLVLAAQADIPPHVRAWLAAIRPDLVYIDNQYRVDFGSMSIGHDELTVLESLLADLKHAQHCIPIATDQRGYAETLHNLLAGLGFHGLCITAHTKDEPENRAFRKAPNEKMNDYDYVIYSPTITIGEDWQAEIEMVYGFFLNNTTTPDAQRQQLGRARKARRFVVYSAIVGGRDCSPSRWRKDKLMQRMFGHTTAIRWDAAGNPLLDDPRHIDYLNLALEIEVQRDRALSFAHSHFIQAAKRNFEVTLLASPEQTSAKAKRLAKLKKEARQHTRERWLDLLDSVTPLSDEDLQKLQQRDAALTEHYAGNEKWRTADEYQQPYSRELYAERTNRAVGGIKRLKRFDYAHKPSETLRELDAAQARRLGGVYAPSYLPAHKRDYYVTNLPLLKACLATLWGETLDPTRRFTTEEFSTGLLKFEQQAKAVGLENAFKRRKNTSYRPDREPDEEHEREKLLRWALSLLGLRLKVWRQRDGCREYSLDAERYREVVTLANIRREALGEDKQLPDTLPLQVCAAKSFAQHLHKAATDPPPRPESPPDAEWAALSISQRLEIVFPALRR